MKITELKPNPTDKVLFKLSSFKFVTKNAGCYILTNFENEILYIGLAVNLNKRFLQHLENSEKTSLTENGKAIWFHFTEYDKTNLEKLERSWINQYTEVHSKLPILNKINSPIH